VITAHWHLSKTLVLVRIRKPLQISSDLVLMFSKYDGYLILELDGGAHW
jgi:hypothetical protein